MKKGVTEHRKHKRRTVTCPLTVFSLEGEMLGSGDTINISEGGAFLAIPGRTPPDVETPVEVTLLVPRSPRKTDSLDIHASAARVVRHEPRGRRGGLAMAIQFDKPVPLAPEA